MINVKKYLILIIFTLAAYSIWSQGYEYIPFPDSNCIWSEKYTAPMYPGEPPTFYIYALFNDDTTINSIQYHKLYILYDSVIVKSKAAYIGAIREDSTRKIYYKGDHIFWQIDDELLNENNEVLLYDFSVNVGDTIRNVKFAAPQGPLVVSEIDTVELNHGRRRVIYFQDHYNGWIEGIGTDMGLLSPGDYPTNGTHNELICFRKNDTLVYLNSDFSGCYNFPSSISDNQSVNNFGIYPNPIVGTSYLDLEQSFDILEIYSYRGTKIRNINITGLKSCEINSSLFTPGLYFYKITSYKGIIRNGRFIVIK